MTLIVAMRIQCNSILIGHRGSDRDALMEGSDDDLNLDIGSDDEYMSR